MPFRKELLELLRAQPMSLAELARLLDASPKQVEDDLRHLVRSLKHEKSRLVVTPARCRHCGFHFQKDKLHKPGKCPQCHGTWIQEPLLEIK